VAGGCLRKQHLARLVMQAKAEVVELGHQLLSRDRAHVGDDEAGVQEAGDHRRVIGREKTPARVRAALVDQFLKLHVEITILPSRANTLAPLGSWPYVFRPCSIAVFGFAM